MNKELSSVAAVVAVSFASLSAQAATAPVAAGYPDWQGLTDKNYVMGRQVTPSDLRHKVTIVLDVEPSSSLSNLLIKAAGLAGFGRTPYGETWENVTVQRDAIFVVSCRDKKGRQAVLNTIDALGKSGTESSYTSYYKNWETPFYEDVTFPGAPDSTGKRPYVYVMGPSGTEPVYQGMVSDKTVKEARAAIQKELAKMRKEDAPKWVPFFGFASEPKYFPQVTKAFETGKPALLAVEKSLLKDVQAKDPEKAKEAQILYDALNQARSDLALRIFMEASGAPHVAYSDIQKFMKYWPNEKKRFEDILKKIDANADLKKMAKIFATVMQWSDPNFTCKNAGEAKKIVVELKKMKKILDRMTDSSDVMIQNGAALTGAKIDELVDQIPNRVAAK